jgi:hypothetical protein
MEIILFQTGMAFGGALIMVLGHIAYIKEIPAGISIGIVSIGAGFFLTGIFSLLGII